MTDTERAEIEQLIRRAHEAVDFHLRELEAQQRAYAISCARRDALVEMAGRVGILDPTKGV